MTTAARKEQALAIFLAAVHVCAPDLADPPGTLLSHVSMQPAEIWDRAVADPRARAIASALSARQVEQVGRVLAGICRDLSLAPKVGQ